MHATFNLNILLALSAARRHEQLRTQSNYLRSVPAYREESRRSEKGTGSVEALKLCHFLRDDRWHRRAKDPHLLRICSACFSQFFVWNLSILVNKFNSICFLIPRIPVKQLIFSEWNQFWVSCIKVTFFLPTRERTLEYLHRTHDCPLNIRQNTIDRQTDC